MTRKEGDTRIPGLIIDDDLDSTENLGEQVESLIVILRLKGQSQLYALDVTNEIEIRDCILAHLGEG